MHAGFLCTKRLAAHAPCLYLSGRKRQKIAPSVNVAPKKVRLFRNGDGNFDVRTTVIQELFFVKFHEPLRKRRIVRNAKQFV